MIRLLSVTAIAAIAAVALVATQPQPAAAQGCGFQAFDAEFRQLTTNYPQQSHWGARDTYQYSYFLGVRDQGLRGCQQLSTSPSSCVPNYPG